MPTARPAVALENVDGAVIDRLTSPKPREAAVRTDADSRNITIGSIQTFTGTGV